MFVRWKHRQLHHGHDVAHYAVLVENTWRNGASRQRVICHLAHIRGRHFNAPAHQDWFWRRVKQRLDALKIEPATRKSIEARLQQRVSVPSADELAQVVATRNLLKHLES